MLVLPWSQETSTSAPHPRRCPKLLSGELEAYSPLGPAPLSQSPSTCSQTLWGTKENGPSWGIAMSPTALLSPYLYLPRAFYGHVNELEGRPE